MRIIQVTFRMSDDYCESTPEYDFEALKAGFLSVADLAELVNDDDFTVEYQVYDKK